MAPSAWPADTPVDAVVVTATRRAQTVDETLASVTVVTRADIERTQARSIADALRGLDGVSVANNGGPGKETSLFVRGTNPSHVLVLIDGVKVGSPTLGLAALQDLPIDQIERIEIVRGPRSSLYGSEAIGGVIQIFTKKGGGELRPSASVGGGSYRTGYGSAGLSGGGDKAWFNVSASGFSTQGFDACRGDPVTFQGCGTIEPDRDGYRNASSALRAGYRFDADTEAEAYVLNVRGYSKYDGTVSNESRIGQDVYGARVRFAPNDAWRVTTTAGRYQDRSDNYLDAAFANKLDTQRDVLSLQNDFTTGHAQQASLGFDWQQDKIIGDPGTYAVNARDNLGAFVQYQIGLGAHDVQASLRHDDNQQFGGHDTGGLAWGYALAGAARLIASHGTGFKAPTFNDLYWPGAGNPDLKPETSRSTEFGARGTPGGDRWSVTAFQTELDNMINWAPVGGGLWRPSNVDSARIRGAEATYAVRSDHWDVRGQATRLDPVNRTSGATFGKTLVRRARQSARLDFDRRFGLHSAGIAVIGEGRRYDDADNTVALAGYALVDLRAEYRIDRDWRIQGRAANVLDKPYETAAFYNQPGRSYFITLRYQPAK